MKTRDHASAVQARVEASRCGYAPVHRTDGLDVWKRNDGTEIALVRERRPRSTVWHWTKEFPPDGAARCQMCKRLLDQPDDPDSKDCGGDCWKCIKECEENMT